MYWDANITVSQAVGLTKAQYLTEKWRAEDIHNHFKKLGGNDATDAADLVAHLVEQQRKDPQWFVDTEI